jgi:hypothetical protein
MTFGTKINSLLTPTQYLKMRKIIILLTIIISSMCQAQEVAKIATPFSTKKAIHLDALGGIQTQDIYLGFFGMSGLRFDKEINKNIGYSTGVNVLFSEFGVSVGVPIYMQLKYTNKYGRGIFWNFGLIAQHGYQPFFLPAGEVKLRLGVGKNRFFIDLFSTLYFARGIICANGTYSCRYYSGTNAAGLGSGFSVGTYLR